MVRASDAPSRPSSQQQPLTVAFLSTPSVYFSLAEGSATRASSVAFGYDKQWQGHLNYRFFDFDDAEGTRSATAHFFWKSAPGS